MLSFCCQVCDTNEACGNDHVNTIQMQSANIRQCHTITIGLEYDFVGSIHSMHM